MRYVCVEKRVLDCHGLQTVWKISAQASWCLKMALTFFHYRNDTGCATGDITLDEQRERCAYWLRHARGEDRAGANYVWRALRKAGAA